MAYDTQVIQVQYYHEKVFDGKEDQHWMQYIKEDHDHQSNREEGAILDKEALHDVPDFTSVLLQKRITLILTTFLWC